MTDAAAKRLYLARHGETEWNVARRGQGRLDSPLTERGVRQAERLGEFAASKRIELVLSSPLGRAARTAGIAAAAAGAEIVLLEELAEIDHGRMSGLSSAEIALRMPGALLARSRDRFHWRYPDGESYASALPRARRAIETASASESGRVLLVSHEMIGRLLRMTLLGLAPDEALALSQPNDVVVEVSAGRATEHALG